MGRQNKASINRLQTLLPEGRVVTTAWLGRHGYSRQLVAKYVRAGWLAMVVRGVYRRPGPPLRWQHAVASLGELMERPPHVGGLSALELRGKAHFLKLRGPGAIHLYSARALPNWAHKLPLPERLVEHRETLFDGARKSLGIAGLAGSDRAGDTHSTDALEQSLVREPWGPWDWDLVYSTPERAILELLDEVPHRQSAEHAMALFGLLTDLSSRRAILLLKACRSVKVKRLFLALASRHSFHWVKPVLAAAERGEIPLGSGKRALIEGGRLDPKYLITLPGDRGV